MRQSQFISLFLGLAVVCVAAHNSFADETAVAIPDQQRVWRPLSPSDAARSFETHPEFQMELVASEPLVQHPIAMAFDEFGRLFIAETPLLASTSSPSQGVIRLLEDTDGDGIFDTGSVYSEELTRPRGLACWDGGIFVLQGSDLSFLKDIDGDKRADINERVFTGFEEEAGFGIALPLSWGVDNRLYGQSGGKVERADAPNAPRIDLNGHGFVVEPRSRTIGMAGGYGPCGMAFDSWGRQYVASEGNLIQAVLTTGSQNGREQPAEAFTCHADVTGEGTKISIYAASAGGTATIADPSIAEDGLKPSGLVIHEGDAWPAPFQENLLVLDAGHNLIHRRVFSDLGLPTSTRRAEVETEFLRSTDSGFHPIQASGGPDGNLYVLDRYGENYDSLGEANETDDSSQKFGRVYRLAPKHFHYSARPLPGPASAEERVAMLAHPNDWHRQTAARMLSAEHNKEHAPALDSLARTSERAGARIHALYALAGIGALNNDLLQATMSCEHAKVRMHALRLAASRLLTDATNAHRVIALTDDPDPYVRLEAVHQLNALPLALRATPLVRVCRSNGGNPVFLDVILSQAQAVAPTVLHELAQNKSFCTASENLHLLRGLARLSLLSPDVSENPFMREVLALIPEDAGEARLAITEGFAAGAVEAGRWNLLKRLAETGSPLAEVMSQIITNARTSAGDQGVGIKERLEAIRLLSGDTFENAGGILSGLLTQSEPVDIQSAAVQALGIIGTPRMAPSFLEAWPRLGPEIRRQAMSLMLSGGDYVANLLDAVEAGAISVDALVQWGFLDLANHSSILIRQRVGSILANAQREALVDTSALYQKLRGIKPSLENGALVFKDNCFACHRINGNGNPVGPDLDFMAQAGTYKVLEHILNPNAVVMPNFFSYTLETNDFQSFTGIIAKEETSNIVVRGPNGEEHMVARDNIASLTCSDKTIMPIGWDIALGEQKLADLVAYLVEAGKKPVN